MTRGHSTVDGVEVLDHDELEDVGEMSSVTQRVAFDTENTVVIHARIAGMTTSDWHHHGDRHDYGYVIKGHVALEFGPGGRETLDAYTGDFIHVEPGEIHRTRNPTDEDAVLLATLVGSGPLAVNVEGPPDE